MNTVDPHWQIEQEESHEIPVRVRGNPPSPPPMSLASPAARRPAAIVGVLMVLLTGFFFIHGVQTLRGQANAGKSPFEIRITKDGFHPKTTEAKAGQEIRWTNDDPEVPHILTSDTLLTTDGPLYTDHILPGETFTATITPDAKAGTFVYISLTEDIAGEVVIADLSPTTPMTTTAKTVTAPKTPQSQKSSQARLSPEGNPQGVDLSSLTAQAVPQGLIPRNPYTVGSPLSSPSGTVKTIGVQPLASGTAQKPFRQPETGPGLWIVSCLSIGALWWMTRKQCIIP